MEENPVRRMDRKVVEATVKSSDKARNPVRTVSKRNRRFQIEIYFRMKTIKELKSRSALRLKKVEGAKGLVL